MAATESLNLAATLPGPPELLPGRPDAIVDLQTDEGAALVGGQWRYSDAKVEEIDFVALGSAEDPLGPGRVPNRTYDVVRDGVTRNLSPSETQLRLANGRVCFNWYEIDLTIPERVGDFDPAGSTVVFEVVIDDYAEVWVNGELPVAIGDTGGRAVVGFNAPNRVVLTRDAKAGETFSIAVFGINGPISASPHNYIWMRTATLDVYAGERAPISWPSELHVEGDLTGILPSDGELERVAAGFEFTEGPVWARDGSLLFSSPNTNAIYRWDPVGRVTVFRSKSGYTGTDIGRFHQPGSNGLTFDRAGRLTLCQHGNRRVVRIERHGNVTVVADAFGGRRLNSPNDVVCRSDGSIYFTDPGLRVPLAERELPYAAIYRIDRSGAVSMLADFEYPHGLAFSPDERTLYVANTRWAQYIHALEIGADGAMVRRRIFADMSSDETDGVPDGMKVDVQGRVYCTGPGGTWVFAPEGTRLGIIRTPEVPANLAFGGPDLRTLFFTARTSVYSLRV